MSRGVQVIAADISTEHGAAVVGEVHGKELVAELLAAARPYVTLLIENGVLEETFATPREDAFVQIIATLRSSGAPLSVFVVASPELSRRVREAAAQ